MRKKPFLFFLCLFFLSACIPVHAATPPDLTWCTVAVFSDRAELSFYTPEAYLTSVDSYEFRQGGTAWTTVAGKQGGKLILRTGGTVYLRCVGNGTYGSVFSYYIEFGDCTICSDSRSGLSAVFRSSSGFSPDTVMTANRIRSGSYYETVYNAVATGQDFILYDIYFSDANGTCFDPDEDALIRIPFTGTIQYGYCSVYHMDETNHRILPVSCWYDRTNAVFRTQGSGLYFVVGAWKDGMPLLHAEKHAIGTFFDFYGTTILCGDVSGNGFVESADARLILRAAVHLDALTAEQEEAADVNADGTVSASDARSVLRKCVGLSE